MGITVTIRGLGVGDLRQVLAIERRAFPQDPWTASMANGWLARVTRGGRARYAGGLSWLLQSARVHQAISLARLLRWALRQQPANRYYLVAEAGGEIAGYACYTAVAGQDADFQLLAVRQDRQSQGVGKAMLARAIGLAATHGCPGAFLYVRADNPAARRLYERAGFTPTGLLPRFYQPSGTDAIVMRLSIPVGRVRR